LVRLEFWRIQTRIRCWVDLRERFRLLPNDFGRCCCYTITRCAGVDGGPVYGACSPQRGLILLCGVEDHVLDQSTSSSSSSSSASSRLSRQFPSYADWKRLRHDVHQSLLVETFKTLMSRDDQTTAAAVQLLQTTARCDVRLIHLLLLPAEAMTVLFSHRR